MTQSRFDNSGSKVWAEWHRQRAAAERNAMSTDEFSDQEIEDYDLDTISPQLDGRSNPEQYTIEPYPGDKAIDYREVDPRF